jgi:hypothetical protein
MAPHHQVCSGYLLITESLVVRLCDSPVELQTVWDCLVAVTADQQRFKPYQIGTAVEDAKKGIRSETLRLSVFTVCSTVLKMASRSYTHGINEKDCAMKLLLPSFRSLCHGMIETKSSRDLPPAFFESPNVNKFCFSYHAMFLCVGMEETVHSNLNRAVAGNRMDFQRARNECTEKFAANILRSGVDHRFAPYR